MEQLDKLNFLLEKTPHGVIEILLKNLSENDEISSGVPSLDDFLRENFDDDLNFLKATIELSFSNLNNLISCFKDEG